MKNETKRIIKRTIGFLLIGEIVACFTGGLCFAINESFLRAFVIMNCVYGIALLSCGLINLILWLFNDKIEK